MSIDTHDSQNSIIFSSNGINYITLSNGDGNLTIGRPILMNSFDQLSVPTPATGTYLFINQSGLATVEQYPMM